MCYNENCTHKYFAKISRRDRPECITEIKIYRRTYEHRVKKKVKSKKQKKPEEKVLKKERVF